MIFLRKITKNHHFSLKNNGFSKPGPSSGGLGFWARGGLARIRVPGTRFFFCSWGGTRKKKSRTRYAKKNNSVPLKSGVSNFQFSKILGLRDFAYLVRLFRYIE